MMTQNEEILEYLNVHGSISDIEAYLELGCRRLASRICDLRKMGYSITSEDEPHTSRSGRKGYHTRYRLTQKGW